MEETSDIFCVYDIAVEHCPDNSTVQFEKFDKICRSCLLEGQMDSIFQLRYKGLSFKDILEICTSIQVTEGDNMPQGICRACSDKIARFYNFILRYQHSQDILKKVLENYPKEEFEDDAEQIIVVGDTAHSSSESDKDETGKFRRRRVNVRTNNKLSKQKFIVQCKEEESTATKTESDEKLRRQLKSRPVYSCRACSISFETSCALKEHRKQVRHLRPRNHVCNICNRAFSYSKLREHMITHTKERRFECNVCYAKFTLICNLRRHMNIHTGERPHNCDICGKGFIQANTMVEHRRVHTGETPYVCSYCGKSFSQASRHKTHLRRHLIENGESEAIQELTCDVCQKLFSTRGALKTHYLLHGEKSYLCSNCGKGFSTNAGLQSHRKTHTGAKPYTCGVCMKSFSQLGSLKSHSLIHTGEKPFVCKLCSKSFKQRNHLMYHMRIHSGEKPYTCSYCGKSFSLNGTLTVHVRTHTGETPYECDVCAKGFYDSSSMKKHRKGHNNCEKSCVSDETISADDVNLLQNCGSEK